MFDFIRAIETNTPPTPDDLVKARENLSGRIKKNRGFRNVMIALWVVQMLVGIGFGAAYGGHWEIVVMLSVVFLPAALLFETAIQGLTLSQEGLVPLDPEAHPSECIALEEARKKDEVLNDYLESVARMGRKPVVAEWRAAKRWMETSEHRKKVAQAREICKQFEA